MLVYMTACCMPLKLLQVLLAVRLAVRLHKVLVCIKESLALGDAVHKRGPRHSLSPLQQLILRVVKQAKLSQHSHLVCKALPQSFNIHFIHHNFVRPIGP